MEIDVSLIQKAQTGNVEAFGEIFKGVNKRIYNFLLHLSSDRELAEDLTQETFIRAFKSLKSLKNSEAFVSWLHRIALNLYRDEMKKPHLHIAHLHTEGITRNFSEDDEDEFVLVANEELRPKQNTNVVKQIPDETNNPEKIATDKELQNVVREAISTLPEIHRTAVIMHHIEGMEVNEIAKTLKIRKGTVMSRLARARETLRRKLTFYVGDR